MFRAVISGSLSCVTLETTLEIISFVLFLGHRYRRRRKLLLWLCRGLFWDKPTSWEPGAILWDAASGQIIIQSPQDDDQVWLRFNDRQERLPSTIHRRSVVILFILLVLHIEGERNLNGTPLVYIPLSTSPLFGPPGSETHGLLARTMLYSGERYFRCESFLQERKRTKFSRRKYRSPE